MKLERLEFRELKIPFRSTFSHASASREVTSTVWVEARTTDGTVGHGESCPRPYVTGETVNSARSFFERHREELCETVDGLAGLRAFVSNRRTDIDANPAGFAAIELCLLDALAWSNQCSVEALLGLPELSGVFRYSAVIGTGTFPQFEHQLGQYLQLGLRDLKLKLSGDLDLDKKKLIMAKGHGMRLRVDANNLWRSTDEACRYISGLEMPLVGVEEPLAAMRFTELAGFSESSGVRVILDESLLRVGQVEALSKSRHRFIANLRVSKLGGLLRSLEILAALQTIGVPVVVGAHVGETSLLTRVAMILASRAGAALFAHEGAFGTRLLVEDPFSEPLMFGLRGQLRAPLPGRGFGLELRDCVALRRDSTSPLCRG